MTQGSSVQQLRELARRQARRRLILKITGGVLGVPTLLFFCLFTWNYLTLPPAEALTAAEEEAAAQDPFFVPASARLRSVVVLPASPELKIAAKAWVDTHNANNPGMFLIHEIDGYGNLYLVPGWWFHAQPDEAQMGVTDHLGVHWRQYLREAFGPWDALTKGVTSPDQFAPGIIMVGPEGEISRSMDGHVRHLGAGSSR